MRNIMKQQDLCGDRMWREGRKFTALDIKGKFYHSNTVLCIFTRIFGLFACLAFCSVEPWNTAQLIGYNLCVCSEILVLCVKYM